MVKKNKLLTEVSVNKFDCNVLPVNDRLELAYSDVYTTEYRAEGDVETRVGQKDVAGPGPRQEEIVLQRSSSSRWTCPP